MKHKNKKAFTLIETMIAMTIIGVIATIMITMLKPTNIREDVLKKAGAQVHGQIDFAVQQIVLKHTNNFTMKKLTSGKSIASTDSLSEIVGYLKKYLIAKRKNNTIPSAYASTNFVTSSGATVSLNVNSFGANFVTRNGAYIALKLNGNCTTTETTVYHPIYDGLSNAKTKSCGLIFYDVNGDEMPNRLMLDQYIVAISEFGLK